MEGIELSEMITSLRQELERATEEGAGKDIKFLSGDVELELQVKVSKQGGGKVGVKFWVVNAEANGKISSESIQKIKLKLTPTKNGKRFLVNDVDDKPT